MVNVDVVQTRRQGDKCRQRGGNSMEGEAVQGTKPLPSLPGVRVVVISGLVMGIRDIT